MKKTIQEIKNQIGCGYCSKEGSCKLKEPKVNKARNGCKEFKHFRLDPDYRNGKYFLK